MQAVYHPARETACLDPVLLVDSVTTRLSQFLYPRHSAQRAESHLPRERGPRWTQRGLKESPTEIWFLRPW